MREKQNEDLPAAPKGRKQLVRGIGAKGANTRRRLLGATERLLRSTPMRALNVRAICREAQTSSATFYVYFNDVSEIVLALIGGISQSPPNLLLYFAEPWPPADALDRAKRFVATYFENWETHASLLRVRDAVSEEGDERFSQTSFNAVAPLIAAMAEAISASAARKLIPENVESHALATALLALIERIAFHPASHRYNVSKETLQDVAAYLVAAVFAGPPARPSGRRALRAEGRAQRLAPLRPLKAFAAAPKSNLNGQSLGLKGVNTRRRILQATAKILGKRPLWSLSVSDIAREAQLSHSSFYLYFEDIAEAVLALLEEAPQSTPATLSLAAQSWAAGTPEAATEFVRAYIDHWRSHQTLFRVRNVAADEGDIRFAHMRARSLWPLLTLLADRIAELVDSGYLPQEIHPFSAAGAALGMIEHLASTPTKARHGNVTLASATRAAGYCLSVLTQTADEAEKTPTRGARRARSSEAGASRD